ncbi:DUF2868 domain-containing protein [Desulfonema ishimotonii]|uniref:DUF2868 domain-containing protein n=1 Tax=Desulfonema ishimotonii TaxID=45657 RepID=A0A401FUI6_9BACT|nr:DUF2868 domain-containing protein [Desulfonema ishimotonii]GBC60608.1 DUF2868 domain-containing protein [Desulfonema ishimotonii]
MRRTQWQLKDIIDLEYFLHESGEGEGSESDRAAERQRDREIYLRRIQPRTEAGGPPDRRFMLRAWLEERRAAEKAPPAPEVFLPGEAFDEIYRIALWIFVFLGIFSGAGVAFSLLTYTGHEPLNVSVYLGTLVFLQIAWLLMLLSLLALRMINRRFLNRSLIYTLLSRLLIRLILRFRGKALRGVSGDRRERLRAAVGLMRGKQRIYGFLLYCPAFILAQIFGVGFNVGALGATLLRVMGADLAFGWQSTLQVSAQAVHEMVRWIALPWSWLVPASVAYPSPEQIEGSHMILKDGIYHLATRDLVSWWPFLCFAVLFYGLLPRMLLLLSGLISRNRALSKLAFTHSACDRLIHRLETPGVRTEGRPSAAPPVSPPETPPPPAADTPPVTADEVWERGLIALVPDDIFDACQDRELALVLDRAMGFRLREKVRIGEDYEGDVAVLDRLAQTDWGTGCPMC